MLIPKKQFLNYGGTSVERLWRKYHQCLTELTCLIGHELGRPTHDWGRSSQMSFEYVYCKWCVGYDLWVPTRSLEVYRDLVSEYTSRDVSQIKLTVIQHCCSQRFGRWTPEKPRNLLQQIKHTQTYWPLVRLDFVLTNIFQSHPPTKGLLLAGFLPSTVSVASLFSICSNDHSFGIRKRITRQMPEARRAQTHTKACEFTRIHLPLRSNMFKVKLKGLNLTGWD